MSQLSFIMTTSTVKMFAMMLFFIAKANFAPISFTVSASKILDDISSGDFFKSNLFASNPISSFVLPKPTSLSTTTITKSPASTPIPTPVTNTNTVPQSNDNASAATIAPTNNKIAASSSEPQPTTSDNSVQANLSVNNDKVIDTNQFDPSFASTPSSISTPLSLKTSNVVGENEEIGRQIFDLLNKYRASLGLSQLTWNDEVYKIALEHTLYMVKQKVISHDGFDDRSKGWTSMNENVAMFSIGTDDMAAQKFIDMWKGSPGHDANMRAPQMNEGAVAVYYLKSNSTYYSTMNNVLTDDATSNAIEAKNEASSKEKVNSLKNDIANQEATEVIAEGENRKLGEQTFEQLNSYRVSKGLKRLTWNEKAYKLAVAHSADMAKTNNPSYDGSSERAKNFSKETENIAMYKCQLAPSTIPPHLIDAWKTVAADDSKMKDSSITDGAVSVNYVDSRSSYYATMINAKP